MAANGESTPHASSVPLPEIPVKLRCTICSGLAQGAVRLPCCEQSICESCRINLPDVCPVCDHSPLSADDCKPNVALRTTVAVFLRTAEKKHALSLQKEQKASQKSEETKLEIKAPEPPLVKQNPTPERAPGSPAPKASPTLQPTERNGQVSHDEQPATLPEEKQEPNPPEMPTGDSESAPTIPQENGYGDNQQHGWFNPQTPDQMSTQQQQMFQGQGYPAGSGWGPYNQMMPDVANGWNNGFGGNMMGYSMMMNPMAMSQAGYNGGDYGNMGPGGIGGGFNGQGGNGMGWSNGWSGQGNMGFSPGMNGMRNGGYYSAASAGGYNHQSHGNPQLPAQQYQTPHFQRQQATPRAGSAGSAGSATSGFTGLQQQSTYTPERPQSQQPDIDEEGDAIFLQQLQGIDEAVAAVKASGANDENQGKDEHNEDKQGEKIPSVVSNDPENIAADPKDIPTETASTVVAGLNEDIVDTVAGLPPSSSASNAPMNKPNMAQYTNVDDMTGQGLQQQIQPLPPTRPHSQHAHIPPTQPQQVFHPGHRGNFRGNTRGAGFKGGIGVARGGYYPVDAMSHSVSPIDKKPLNGPGVEGAPTGPKAMREGGANRGMIRGRGGFVPGRGNFGPNWARSISPTDQPRERDKGRSYSPSVSSESRRRSRSPRDRYRSRSKDRSRTRRRRSKSRDRRRRSPSVESELRGRTPTRDEKSLPSPVEDDVNTPILPSDVQEDPKDSQRTKRSRESSESRVRSISESRSPSRSPDRRHKRSRRHKNRSASPEKSSRHHKRSHQRSRRYRDRSHSRSRSPRREDVSEDDKAAGPREDNVQAEKRSRRDSRDREKERDREKDRERRHRKRSRRDDSRDRSRDRHRSHRHKTKHERSDRKDIEGDEPSDRRESQDMSTPSKAAEKKQSRLSRSDRKVSVKYEDELDLTRQAERDREAERWGVK